MSEAEKYIKAQPWSKLMTEQQIKSKASEYDDYLKKRVEAELGNDLIDNLKKSGYPKDFINGVLHAKGILNKEK